MDTTNQHDIEIGDIENYTSDKGEYSHSNHVDICIKKCIVAGCKELCEGYNETTTDKNGNTKIVYKEDTRKALIESVKTCKMIMICDFDDDAKTKIKALIENIKTEQTNCLNKQMTYWKNLTYQSKQNFLRNNAQPTKVYFHPELPFWNLFVELELRIYREILEELILLSGRLNHFKAEDFEG